MPLPQTKEELTKCIALNLQMWLTAWHELYPDDTDADACSKSLDMVEFELEDLMTRPDSPPVASADPLPEPAAVAEDDDEVESVKLPKPTNDQGLHSRVQPKQSPEGPPQSFRQMLIEIARAYPAGFDISAAVREAQSRGLVHPSPRNLVSITASALVRGGILVRRDRGTYALSAAFLGGRDDEGEDD